MSQRRRRCQWRAGRIVAAGLLSCATALSPAPAPAHQRSKPEAEAVARARETLASTLSLPIGRLQTVSVTPAEWRDSSLGCPERGMIYTPALVSGYVVTLRDEDRDHVVHVARGRAVICGSRSDPKLSPAPAVSAALKAADAVRKTLAVRLRIEPAAVRIVSTRPWRAATPCSAAPAQPKGAAFIVEARASAQAFRYYSDDALVASCHDEGARK